MFVRVQTAFDFLARTDVRKERLNILLIVTILTTSQGFLEAATCLQKNHQRTPALREVQGRRKVAKRKSLLFLRVFALKFFTFGCAID